MSLRLVVRSISLALPLSVLVGCTDGGILEPTRSLPPAQAHASVVVTPDYSAFDTRSEFNAAGAIDFLNGFEDFTGELVYEQPTPWTTNGVTYTSDLNIILGPGVGLGVSSNSLTSEFGTAVRGTFADADAFTMFGADLNYFGSSAPTSVMITTNLGSYTLTNLGIPLATAGRKFFGIALTKQGEYLKAFTFNFNNGGASLLLDNVAVGHVAAVKNADPVAAVGGPYAGAEGSAVSVSMSASDSDGDALTYGWDFGDGSTGSGSTPPTSHTYADNGSYEIMLAVSDGKGGVDTARTTATVANIAPTLGAFSIPVTPIALNAGGASVPITTTFTDPGTLDTHMASLDCGAGVTVQSQAPNGAVSGTCTFTSAGVYVVRLTVTDDDGGSDTKRSSGQVVIYDPNAGWITGGGWINSPANACPSSGGAAGKLSFSFASKYESASSPPTGNADFKLNQGKLDFHGTSLDWMVVANNSARIEGRGTLNGGGDYGFSLEATDGTVDEIRIRIWRRSTGAVVYDNQPGSPIGTSTLTPLGGGSIQVH
jgi:PKD repeat protein